MPQLVSVQVKLQKKQSMLKKKCLFVDLFNKLPDINNSVCTIVMALYFILVFPGILPYF